MAGSGLAVQWVSWAWFMVTMSGISVVLPMKPVKSVTAFTPAGVWIRKGGMGDIADAHRIIGDRVAETGLVQVLKAGRGIGDGDAMAGRCGSGPARQGR